MEVEGVKGSVKGSPITALVFIEGFSLKNVKGVVPSKVKGQRGRTIALPIFELTERSGSEQDCEYGPAVANRVYVGFVDSASPSSDTSTSPSGRYWMSTHKCASGNARTKSTLSLTRRVEGKCQILYAKGFRRRRSGYGGLTKVLKNCQSECRNLTESSNMLPPVAAVLPAEISNDNYSSPSATIKNHH